MISCRRRSDILINTYSDIVVPTMTENYTTDIAYQRHSVIISTESDEESIKYQLSLIGIDDSIPIFCKKNPDISDSEHKICVIKKLIDLGYEHGFHFDNNKEDIDDLMSVFSGIRCVRIL
jgi:hypothetical protein